MLELIASLMLAQSATNVQVMASHETQAVTSLEDAADDSAIWLHPQFPERSLILGTDKTAGLRIYRLTGEQIAHLPVGKINNIDVRQQIKLTDWTGDLAAASNRSDDSISLFSVTEAGATVIGSFSVAPEPYGFCMGVVNDILILFVAHKQGYIQPYALTSLHEPPQAIPPFYFASQIEGCVYDEYQQQLFAGEEERGIWTIPFDQDGFRGHQAELLDAVDSQSGLHADVEGLTLYQSENGQGYLLASSQGDDSYHVYKRTSPHTFLGKFTITANISCGIDGTQETDGIAATSAALGEQFPAGVFIAQDGFNVATDLHQDGRTADDKPLAPQNFKLVDWRRIEQALGLQKNKQ